GRLAGERFGRRRQGAEDGLDGFSENAARAAAAGLSLDFAQPQAGEGFPGAVHKDDAAALAEEKERIGCLLKNSLPPEGGFGGRGFGKSHGVAAGLERK